LDTIAIITGELKKQGIKQNQLTDFLGIHRNVFTDWKSGRNNSYTKYIYQIAAFLGVSVEYLRGNTDSPTDEQTKVLLSYKEIQLINAYRSHPELQEAVNRILLPDISAKYELCDGKPQGSQREKTELA
jgi:transcriptional regulator with XRE-family HTH domain